jgi:hypothetical protein
MKQEVFENKYGFFIINKDEYEPRELYMERVLYILNKIQNKDDLIKLEKESKMMINKKYFGCDY